MGFLINIQSYGQDVSVCFMDDAGTAVHDDNRLSIPRVGFIANIRKQWQAGSRA